MSNDRRCGISLVEPGLEPELLPLDQGHLVELSEGWSIWHRAVLRGAGLPFDLLDNLAIPELLDLADGPERDQAIRECCARGIDAIVCNETFQEALTWQNPSIMATWLSRYLTERKAGDRPRLGKRAYKEAVIARYAQRYCAKNESIGFFGPVGWARFGTDRGCLRWTGDCGCRGRDAYLEVWAVAALAQAWAARPELLWHLPVRLDPASAWDGQLLRRPRRPPRSPGALEGSVLSALPGKDGACRVSDLVVKGQAASGAARDEVLAAVSRLREQHILQVGFLIPFSEDPEEHLRRQVRDLPECVPGRQEMLGHLAALSRVREQATAARGPDAAYRAITAASGCFSAAGVEPAAVHRQTPYGRLPVYLDCRRDLDVEVGADLIARLGAPLSALLDSVRWLTAELAVGVAGELLKRYRKLRAARSVVTLGDLQFAAAALLTTGGSVVPEIQADFRLRWAEVLAHGQAPAGTGEIKLSSDDIGPLVRALFPVGGTGWAASRQHSPDLMLCHGADGKHRWVVGELHVAMNTLESRVFRTQCDTPQELVSATARDMGDGRVVPLYPPESTEVSSRTYPPLSLDPPGLYRYWSFGSDHGHPDGHISAASMAITVHEDDRGNLIGRDEASQWEAPVLEFFGEFLSALSVNLFRIMEPSAHNPRVVIDDVVVCRESWYLPAAEIPVPKCRSDDYAYDNLREWARGWGIPRHIFVRTASERKPFYVDLASPLLAGLLARAVRSVRAEDADSHVSIVEMCPRPDELWLRDKDGNRYTAEFRIVAVDQRR